MAIALLPPSRTTSTSRMKSVLSGMKTSLQKTTTTATNVRRTLAKTTRIKANAIFRSKQLFNRRRANKRRRDAESQVEAAQINNITPSSAVTSGIAAGGGGFFGRLMKAVGILAVGWLIKAGPMLYRMGLEFIRRVRRLGSLAKSWFEGFIKLPGDLIGIAGAFVTNLATFDFTDSKGRMEKAFGEMQSSLDQMGSAIDETGKLFSTPLTEVVPEGGSSEQQGSQTETGVTPSASSTGQVSEQQVYAYLISKGLTKNQALGIMANIHAESGFRPAADEAGDGSQGVGLFQYTFPSRKEAFLKSVPDYKTNWKGQLDYAIDQDPNTKPYLNRKWNDPKEAASWWMRQWERPDKSLYQSRDKKHNNWIDSFRATPPAPRVTSSSMSLIPQGMNERGGFIQGGSGTTEMQYATHFHIDSKDGKRTPENLAGIREVSFQAAKAMFARGSSVHFGSINQTLHKNPGDAKLKQIIQAEQDAHAKRSSAAVDIQELNSKVKRTFPGQPGSATKFPFKVGEVYMRGGYGREAEILGTNGITVSHGAEGSIASPVSGTDLQASLTPTQTRQVIPVVDTRPTESQRIESSSKGSSMIASVPLPEGDVLNRLMKQKFITDLAYL